MEIVLIVAVADNGVIGAGGAIPWRLKTDLQRFKTMTMGKPVVMGRKTFESFPRRPLPGRTNIVVTRDAAYVAAGATVVHSLEEAVAAADDTAAEDDDATTTGAGHAAEEDALTAVLLLEDARADLDGHAPGHFAHRRQQRQSALVVGQGFVGRGGGAGGQHRFGQATVGGEVKVGEDNLARPQQRPLGL